MSFTPGPWRVGRAGSVVADAPVPEMRGSEDVAYYGGHCICETITPSNARLVAAAPELLAACQAMLANIDHWFVTGEPSNAVESKRLHGLMESAVAKAIGKEAPRA